VLTCLSRGTGVQVEAIFDVRALLTPPLAAGRMVRLSTREWVFVQKSLPKRKCSYLTEKGLISRKVTWRPRRPAEGCGALTHPLVEKRSGLGAFERYGEVLSGAFIALVGVAFWIWPVL
jgi:hypothetical protein